MGNTPPNTRAAGRGPLCCIARWYRWGRTQAPQPAPGPAQQLKFATARRRWTLYNSTRRHWWSMRITSTRSRLW